MAAQRQGTAASAKQATVARRVQTSLVWCFQAVRVLGADGTAILHASVTPPSRSQAALAFDNIVVEVAQLDAGGKLSLDGGSGTGYGSFSTSAAGATAAASDKRYLNGSEKHLSKKG